MSEYTAEQVEADAVCCERVGDHRIGDILRAYAATLRQQTTNSPEIGSKLVGDGTVSDEIRGLLAHVYGMGAARGHHYTVEGGYTAYTHNEWSDAYREAIDEAISEDAETFTPLLRAPAEQGGRVDFSEADGAALRSLKVGEVLTEGQWESACQFVRHQDDIIRNLRAALAQNMQVEAVFVYPNKPTPRAWGYLDDSGVEWAGYDVSQMEAYARAAVALHAERAQGEAVACRYRFGDGSGGWLGWRYADQPPKKAAPGDVVQVEPLYVHTEQGAKGEAAAWQHRHSGYPDEWKECTREEFEYTQKHPDCPREARELYIHAERARVLDGSHGHYRAAALLLRAVVADDTLAFSCQSLGQYRTKLTEKLDGFIAECTAPLAAAPSQPEDAREVNRG